MEVSKNVFNQFNKCYLIFKGVEYDVTEPGAYEKAINEIDKRIKDGETGKVVISHRVE
ncbi:hypothetical protein P7D98_22690 [Enterococcus avium]|uniref:hypothetical protein n=1 Tax=Enterococcus avium TaxID=33945 RepID=UPI00288DC9D6|nr:hypothetical protein [Enterococcus avium]MDT2468447.1 hypothetical protein [Enterococcus avium]MDT2507871.1 hypothetical protein [Enterococcus avium]